MSLKKERLRKCRGKCRKYRPLTAFDRYENYNNTLKLVCRECMKASKATNANKIQKTRAELYLWNDDLIFM